MPQTEVVHAIFYMQKPVTCILACSWAITLTKLWDLIQHVCVRDQHWVSTSNHMFGRVVWYKLPECIFGNFEIVLVKQGIFTIFKNHKGDLFHELSKLNMPLLVNHTKPTNCILNNKLILNLISPSSRPLQISNWTIIK